MANENKDANTQDSALQWLKVVLDCIDYEKGNCRPNEMVGAVISRDVLIHARQATAAKNTNACLLKGSGNT
jgi:hypothetical protein